MAIKPLFGPVEPRKRSAIRPSPENEEIYQRVTADLRSLRRLAAEMTTSGQLEPIVITMDGYILSGHRRYAAAGLIDLKTMRVIVALNVNRGSADPLEYRALLTEFNLQRIKTFEEQVREKAARTSTKRAYQALNSRRDLQELRLARGQADIPQLNLAPVTQRWNISEEKQEFVAAIKQVMAAEARQGYRQTDERTIHYKLLSLDFWRNTRLRLRYENTPASYQNLSNILTRLRVTGDVDPSVIVDESRSVEVWFTFSEISGYLEYAMENDLLDYYRRNLLQDQPDHIELFAEKNTVRPKLGPMAQKYCLPFTSGKGYASFPPRWQIAQRFRRSGKKRLILITVCDFDPEGEVIAQSFVESIRNDFFPDLDADHVVGVKAALRLDQIQDLDLPSSEGLDPKARLQTTPKVAGQIRARPEDLRA